jgi:hypothetical protein
MVKTINYKLSTSTYLKLGETKVFVIFFFYSPSHSLSLSLSLSLLIFFLPLNLLFLLTLPRVCTDAGVRSCGRGSIQVRAYITPVRIHYFCSFSPLPLVEVVKFAWQRLFRLAKGEGITSILRGIPLRFCKAKIQGLYLPS